MEITGNIEEFEYTPTLCDELPEYEFENLEEAIGKTTFVLKMPSNTKVAISRWVSPKRTRSYPYVRVYHTLNHPKRITIIPGIKDEGKDGDRDYLQYDTVSMMSLLGVYVIIAYYDEARKSLKRPNQQKIEEQKFDIEYLKNKILSCMESNLSPLEWNIAHLDQLGELWEKALNAYDRISEETGVLMHSRAYATRRLTKINEEKESYKRLSRKNAKQAALRETLTNHTHEVTSGVKPTITITDFLGGVYYFTVDEIHLKSTDLIQLVEAKNTSNPNKFITTSGNIIDAVYKMMFFTNLSSIEVDGDPYQHESAIRLTAPQEFVLERCGNTAREEYLKLCREAEINNFLVITQ